MTYNSIIELAGEIKRQHRAKIEGLRKSANACQIVLPKPTGLFRNKCPYCKSKLKLTKYSTEPHLTTAWQYWEYICPEEDYRYVKEWLYGDF